MQGIIVAPNSDVWASTREGPGRHLPQGRSHQGRTAGDNKTGNPMKSPYKLLAPFAIAIDQKDNIWISNIIGEHVTRISASDPARLKPSRPASPAAAGRGQPGQRVDLQQTRQLRTGPVEAVGNGGRRQSRFRPRPRCAEQDWQGAGRRHGHPKARTRTEVASPCCAPTAKKPLLANLRQRNRGPWAVSVDGNDHVWISNLDKASAGIVELCGVRQETARPA